MRRAIGYNLGSGASNLLRRGWFMADDSNEQFLLDHAGQWVAWDREQTHVVASGSTFEQVKAAAANAGEQSILVAKVPASTSWMRRSHKLLYVFAVFISLAQPFPTAPVFGSSSPQTNIADNWDDSDDDASVEKRWSEDD
jgi:hypothetical protein